METTRRKFLCATTGTLAGLSLATSPALAGGNQAIRARKDVATLTDTSPDIVALRTAVDRMKTGNGLGANDCRRWRAQAEIHGAILGSFGDCQHANWYFLPWHRGYLHYFEEIIRELSGNDDFALPYWDWTKNRTLPALFWGNGNPLHNPPRANEPGSGRRPTLTPTTAIPDADYNRLLSQTVISRILGITDFESFAGSAVQQLGDSADQGQLEGAPHNYIHRFVGGDMGSGGSPYDPIFWLHHCNVDRLWTEWAARHPNGTPNDPGWLTTSIPHFCDRQGQPTTITVERTLITGTLGYVYDRRPMVVVVDPRARPEVLVTPFSLEESIANNTVSFLAAASNQFATTVSEGVLAGKAEGKQAVRLRIRGIEPPRNPDTVLDLFLNCEQLSEETPITDKSYVGSCTFFIHGGHGHREKEGGVSFAFDLTREFVRLYGDRPLRDDEPLKVSVLARPLVLDPKQPPEWNVKAQEVSPKQVSIDVVRV